MKLIDHCFVICAYKESEYLEACIQSLKKQSVPARIKMVTSTPNAHIQGLAEKYEIPLLVRTGESSLQADWNFAYDNADAEWMTIAHQDDLYNKHYLEELSKKILKYDDAILAYTDYIPVKHGQIGPRDINSKIMRILR